ncbi:hypothetical protein CY34DRAFT_811784 [Suillus luteus UH-Slu-Lm8-n1]|uniref:Uncharacterized protein n=1 Tax=Suillus luteus UH-Slu-Lm8-n1 TaxID=930992 RepID=A0A0D0A2I2_9AGAM|nr:hypothetical protein CY34DRAFT_811784 [Suillus luteus UH-Slu-Lm8-n1]
MLRFRMIPEGIEALHMVEYGHIYCLSNEFEQTQWEHIQYVIRRGYSIHSLDRRALMRHVQIKTLGMAPPTDYRVGIWALLSGFCLQSLSSPSIVGTIKSAQDSTMIKISIAIIMLAVRHLFVSVTSQSHTYYFSHTGDFSYLD